MHKPRPTGGLTGAGLILAIAYDLLENRPLTVDHGVFCTGHLESAYRQSNDLLKA